jgi:hypothetical protein
MFLLAIKALSEYRRGQFHEGFSVTDRAAGWITGATLISVVLCRLLNLAFTTRYDMLTQTVPELHFGTVFFATILVNDIGALELSAIKFKRRG